MRIIMVFFSIITLAAFTLSGCGTGKSETNGTPVTNGGKSTVDFIKQRDKLIVGVKYDTNLFGMKNTATGKVEGFDVDLAKALAKDILGDENKVEFKEVTSKTRIPLLEKGEIDMIIATMTITEERKKQVNFSDVYFKAGQSLLVRKGSTIQSIADLKGKKVIAVKGSTSAKNIKEKVPSITLIEFENYADAFTALKSGKGDVLTTDNAILMGMVQQDPNFVLTGGLFTDEPYGIAMRKNDTKITDTVNTFLKKIKDNGEYTKIYKKWFKEDPKF